MTNNSRKAILVEDDDDEAMLMKLVFSKKKEYTQLIHCTSGDELFALLGRTPVSDISYIMLDLNLSASDGIGLLKTISQNQEWKHIPVIVFTSSENKHDVTTCYQLGANAFVSKPVVLEDLDKAIQAIERFWGEINIRPALN